MHTYIYIWIGPISSLLLPWWRTYSYATTGFMSVVNRSAPDYGILLRWTWINTVRGTTVPGFRFESRGDRATTWIERGVAADRNRNAWKSIVRDGQNTCVLSKSSSEEIIQNKTMISFSLVLEKLIITLQFLCYIYDKVKIKDQLIVNVCVCVCVHYTFKVYNFYIYIQNIIYILI